MRANIKKMTFFLVMTVIVLFVFILPSWVFSSPKKPSIFFFHHSVGGSLIRNGSVRQILAESGFELWDHGRNHPQKGLRNEKGEPSGCYWIPGDNTYPDGLAKLFGLDPNGENAFGRILKRHDVIIFKSCFPASHIQEDNIATDLLKPKRRSLYNYRRHYLSIRDSVDKHPGKFIIIVTQPPLHPSVTDRNEAQRARAFVEWVKSYDYLGGRKNLFVFDYFSLLADPKTNMLRHEFQINPKGTNSHPNAIAQMILGIRFADTIVNIVKFGRNCDLPLVKFDNFARPCDLTRIFKSSIRLSGKVSSKERIKRIFWSDLKGQGGDLSPDKSWVIPDVAVTPGVTKVVVTAVNRQGLRSSAVIGLKYYSGKKREAVLLDGNRMKGRLFGCSYSDGGPSGGRNRLVAMGIGGKKLFGITEIGLDISDFNPDTTHLEIYYDQGLDTSLPRIFISDVGSFIIRVDAKTGYDKIIIPFNGFKYVSNVMDRFVFRGNWGENTKVHISSIKLICSGKK